MAVEPTIEPTIEPADMEVELQVRRYLQGPRAPSETPRRSDPIRRVFSSSDILLRRAVLPADTSSTPDWQLRLDRGRCGPLTATNLTNKLQQMELQLRNFKYGVKTFKP